LAEHDEVVVIEKHHSFGLETSSHNSGVVHAGIYYATGSLKHRLCLEGNRLLYEWSESHSVRVNRMGKLIVAVDEDEIEALEGVAAQARANEVPGIRQVTREEAARLEPSVTCASAFFSETSGVVDQMEFMRSLAAEAAERGAMIAYQHELVAGGPANAGFQLEVRDAEGAASTLQCAAVVNSAGLGADRVAAVLGYGLEGEGETPRLLQTVNKGRYYDIVNPQKARALRHLVYPVPEQNLVGLGVHVTLDIDGGVHLGPDTEWLDDGAALDYRNDDSRREAFWRSAQRYLPALEPRDIAPGQVGFRPKLQRPGEAAQDFLVWHDRGYLHLGGIESPGMTASLAIARRVRELLR